jgi:glucose/arabinose dehydrogenase
VPGQRLRDLVAARGARAALAALAAFAPAAAAQTLFAERVTDGLSRPLYVTTPPGDRDRLFVVEQHTGRIRIFDRGGDALLATPFLTQGGLATGSEQGLLGLAFHPDYAANGLFYVNYTGDDAMTHVVRYRVSAGDPDLADPNSAEPVLRFVQPQSNHNGGWIGFGPDDYLYIASGDGGSSNDTGTGHTEPGGNAQDVEGNLLGKILRIDVDGDDFPADPERNYAIPPTNPFVGTAGDDEIWVYGLRNPWRASFDRETGDLYLGDVGQGAREEIDVQPAASTGGENYGWRLREGTIQTPGSVGGPRPPGAIDPIHDYDRGGGASVTGGYVYRGPVVALRGRYFFADFITGQIWSLVWDRSDPGAFDGTNFTDQVEHTNAIVTDAGTIDMIASFGEDPDGNLFIVDLGGEVFQIAASDLPPVLPEGDHFMLYRVRGSRGAPRFARFGPLTLADRFGSGDYDVLAPAALGLPADKNAEGVDDPATHVVEYRIRPARGAARFSRVRDVRVSNQCGGLSVEVVRPDGLLLPALEDLASPPGVPDPGLHDLDHRLCYRVRVQSRLSDGTRVPTLPRKIQVDVVDQFDGAATRRYDLRRVTRLCSPVAKSGSPVFLSGDSRGSAKTITPAVVENPDVHLLCYGATLARRTIPQSGCGPADPDDSGVRIEPAQPRHAKVIGLFTNDQFGPLRLDTQREVELCIPTAVEPQAPELRPSARELRVGVDEGDGAEGAPALREGAHLRLARGLPPAEQPLREVLHDPEVGGGEGVEPAEAADQHGLGGPAPDPAQRGEAQDDVVVGEGAQRGVVELAARERRRDAVDGVGLCPREAEATQRGGRLAREAARGRERDPALAVDARAAAEGPREVGADREGEREVHLLGQDRGHAGLEGAAEARHAHAPMVAERRSDQRIVAEGAVEGAEVGGGSERALEVGARGRARRVASGAAAGEAHAQRRSARRALLADAHEHGRAVREQQPRVLAVRDAVDRLLEARVALGRSCERVGRRRDEGEVASGHRGR